MTASTSPTNRELLLSEEEIHHAAQRLGEILAGYEASLPKRPVFPKLDRALLREILEEPLPERGRPFSELFDEFEERILPNSTQVAHPRFLAYVLASPHGLAPFAEALSAALNQGCALWALSPVANAIEQKVIAWLAELFGFPEGTTGLLTSGGSTANLTALTIARDWRLGKEARAKGLQAGQAPLVAYTSEEVHTSVSKAMSILGLGVEALRRIHTDEDFRLSMTDLSEQVTRDRAAGLTPFCVIASAGTVTTGAIDPLGEIADFCAAEDLWLHVDGAYGAFTVLSDRHRAALREASRANSLTLDPHKLLFNSLEAGCVLVRNPEHARHSFCFSSGYLAAPDDADLIDYADFGPQLSRSFKALKVWWALRAFGREAYTRTIDRLLDLAAYMARRVQEEDSLELMAPVQLTAVCFRHRGLDEAGTLRLQCAIMESGLAFIGPARIRGEVCLRACFTNLRTAEPDVDEIIKGILELAARAISQGDP